MKYWEESKRYEDSLRQSEEEAAARTKQRHRRIAGGIVAGAAAVTVLLSCTIVPTGYTGVRSQFGQINPNPVPAGFNWKAPFIENIELVNNKQQDLMFDEPINGETSERNAVVFDAVTVTYTISGDKSAWIYAHVTDYKNALLNQGLIASAVKTAAKQLSPTDVTNRALLEQRVQEALQKSVDQKYGDGVVTINKVVIGNAEFEESYQQSILDKQKAQLAYEQQQIENQKNIETAQAEARALQIAAEAEAEANRTIAGSLNENVLRNKYYETWDGRLPQVSGSSGTLIEIPVETAEGEEGK